MKNFIISAKQALALPENDIEKAMEGLFSILRQNLGTQEFTQLLKHIPEAETLFVSLYNAPKAPASARNKVSPSVELIRQSGLTTVQMAYLTDSLIGYVKSACGDVIAAKISSNLPDMMKIAA